MLKRAAPPRLQPPDLRARLDAAVFLVDIRHPRAFGAGHVAGSLNVRIESPQFAERVGWFVPGGRLLINTWGGTTDWVQAGLPVAEG